MDIAVLRAFLMWCAVLNTALLCLAFLVFACCGDWVYRLHSRWFRMPRESFNTAFYIFLGTFKVAILALNLVPYVALRLAA